MTPKQREALEAVEKYGSQNRAAKALGVGRGTLRGHLEAAQKHLDADPAIQGAMAEVGMQDAGVLHSGWIKSDGASMYFQMPKDEDRPEDLAERIKTIFEDVEPRQRIDAPETYEEDLCNVLPLYDVHWGMAAWAKETGHQDYNFDLARDDVMRGLEAVLHRAPKADTCVMLLGGDLLHADDDKAQTPNSHHNLDVAGRMHQACETLISILKYTVTRVLEHHSKVVVRVVRGNHDENSHRIIAFALREWLSNNERATVDLDPKELFQMQWGRTAIFGHHGDKSRAVDFTLKLSDICPFWSDCPHRYAYTGHKHTMEAQRIGGLNWERLEPFAPADMYGSNWTNRRGIKIDSYDKQKGRVNTAIDPLERA